MSMDVSVALQNNVKQNNGVLILPDGTKSKLPGFSDPAKGQTKSLLIVFAVNNVIRTKTFDDRVAIRLDQNSVK